MNRQWLSNLKGGPPGVLVLHVTSNPGGGVWSVVRTLVNYQQGAGYTPILGVAHKGRAGQILDAVRRDVACPILLYRFPTSARGVGPLLGAPIRRWLRLVQDGSPGTKVIVHVHNNAAFGLLRYVVHPTVEAPVVCTIHGSDTLRPGWSHVAPAIAWAMRRARVTLVAVSSATAQEAADRYGMRIQDIPVIHNGIPVTKNLPPRSYMPEGVLRVGFMGAFVRSKGWAEVVEAVRVLRSRGVQVRVAIAGTGPDEQRIRRICVSGGLGEVLGWTRDPDRDFFPALDVLVLPSQAEGIPMSVLEAMSHGVVPVVSAVGGLPEVVVNGMNGILLDSRSPDAIAEVLAKFATCGGLLASLGSSAQATVRERFTDKVMGECYDRLYAQILNLEK